MPPRFFHPQLAGQISPQIASLPSNDKTDADNPNHVDDADETDDTMGWPRIDAHATLDDAEAHHLTRVLRLKASDRVELFDGAGQCARGSIQTIEDRGRLVHIHLDHARRVPRPALELTIAAAVPKGALSQDMVRTLTQLGCDRLIPLHTARSVAHPRPGKLDRLDRAIIESCKQCGRAWRMTLDPPMPFQAALAHDADVKLFAAPQFDGQDNPEALLRAQSIRKVFVIIGPEGGWAPDEVDDAHAAGCLPWCLGPHTMRIETAAAAAAAIVRYLIPTN